MAVSYIGKISAADSVGTAAFSINPALVGAVAGDVIVLMTTAVAGVAAPTFTGVTAIQTRTQNSTRSDLLVGTYGGGTITLDYAGNVNNKTYFFTFWRGAAVPSLSDVAVNFATTTGSGVINYPTSVAFPAAGYALFTHVQYNSGLVYNDIPSAGTGSGGSGGSSVGLNAVSGGSHGQSAGYRNDPLASGATDPGGTYSGPISGLDYQTMNIAVHEPSGNPIVMVI